LAIQSNGYKEFGRFKKTFESIGFHIDTLFPGCTYSLMGRKGLPIGKAKFNINKYKCDPANYTIYNLKTALISNAPTNEMYDYPSCYEKYIYRLSPYVPKPHIGLNKIETKLHVYPNPSFEGHWTVSLPKGATKIEVIDAVGRILFSNIHLNGLTSFELSVNDLNNANAKGVYIGRIFNDNNQLITVGRLVN
jgi:hypothetical protein